MGKFNFEETGRKSNFENFVPIEVRRFKGGNAKIKRPILNMSISEIRIGAFLGKELSDKKYTHVRFMRSGASLGIQFLNSEAENSVALRKYKKTGEALIASFSSVAKYLMETTDLVNLNVYNYQFDVHHDEKNIYYIELNKPWKKTKKKGAK